MSIPSVVLAEASWYGSIRAGISSSSGDNASVSDFSSRWGIKGSSEVAEGLTAVYRFEQKINSSNADQSGGRLSYVGLSGGFGTVTVGQVWSASYNNVGVITDNTFAKGPGGLTSYRVGNAISYALSLSGVSLQLDAILDSAKAESVDQVEFGMSVDIGEIGKVAFAHVNKQAYTETKTLASSSGSASITRAFNDTLANYMAKSVALKSSKGDMFTGVSYSTTSNNKDFTVSTRTLYAPADVDFPTDYTKYTVIDGKAYLTASCVTGSGDTAQLTEGAKCTESETQYYYDKNQNDEAKTTKDFNAVEDTNVNVAGNVVSSASVTTTPDKEITNHAEVRTNHIAAQATFGAVTGYVGWTQEEEGTVKTKTTHFGISGGLGESGITYLIEANDNDDGTPWGISLGKRLGGGASIHVEHGNDGDKGSSVAFLKVDF